MNRTQRIRTLAQTMVDAKSIGFKARQHAARIVYAIERNNPKLMQKHVLSLSQCKGQATERMTAMILMASFGAEA